MTTASNDIILGLLGASRKPDERRLPLHPDHLERIAPELRSRIVVEHGYGERFGVSDEQIAPWVRAVAPRAEVIAAADVVLLPKPQVEDLHDLRPGQTLWGWPHCVQDRELTQGPEGRGMAAATARSGSIVGPHVRRPRPWSPPA